MWRRYLFMIAENCYARIIRIVGIVVIVVGIIGSIILARAEAELYFTDVGTFTLFLTYAIPSVVSGILIMGFAEVINLLDDNYRATRRLEKEMKTMRKQLRRKSG